jgi:hypothetical protein
MIGVIQMPTFPPLSTPINSSFQSVTLRDRKGDTSTVQVPLSGAGAVTSSALRDAIGNLSNAGVQKNSVNVQEQIPATAVITFDESENSVEAKAVLKFENTVTGETVTVSIPAPDASIFEADMYTVDATNTSVAALITLLQGANYLGADYAFARGYFQARSRGARRAYVPATLVEPDDLAGELPPGLPGE